MDHESAECIIECLQTIRKGIDSIQVSMDGKQYILASKQIESLDEFVSKSIKILKKYT